MCNLHSQEGPTPKGRQAGREMQLLCQVPILTPRAKIIFMGEQALCIDLVFLSLPGRCEQQHPRPIRSSPSPCGAGRWLASGWPGPQPGEHPGTRVQRRGWLAPGTERGAGLGRGAAGRMRWWSRRTSLPWEPRPFPVLVLSARDTSRKIPKAECSGYLGELGQLAAGGHWAGVGGRRDHRGGTCRQPLSPGKHVSFNTS